jgi:hypothetical protein
MKLLLRITALALTTLPALAQAGERGVSRPDPSPILTDEVVAQKPSAARPLMHPDASIVTTTTLPATETTAARDDSSAYHPYRPAGPVTPLYPSALNSRPTPEHDPDADIVTSVPLRPGEISEGTLLKVRMNDPLSTRGTVRGAPFSATVAEDVRREGVVVIPAGSILSGTVTEVHGGRRISGRAALHLEPRRVTLPDGRYFVLHAQVIETGEDHLVKVDHEGTIVHKSRTVEDLAIVSLATGSGAVAGAVLGGGVGALVGAGVGAGVSTVVWLKQDRQAALPRNTALTFALTAPMMMQTLQDGASLRP